MANGQVTSFVSEQLRLDPTINYKGIVAKAKKVKLKVAPSLFYKLRKEKMPAQVTMSQAADLVRQARDAIRTLKVEVETIETRRDQIHTELGVLEKIAAATE